MGNNIHSNKYSLNNDNFCDEVDDIALRMLNNLFVCKRRDIAEEVLDYYPEAQLDDILEIIANGKRYEGIIFVGNDTLVHIYHFMDIIDEILCAYGALEEPILKKRFCRLIVSDMKDTLFRLSINYLCRFDIVQKVDMGNGIILYKNISDEGKKIKQRYLDL